MKSMLCNLLSSIAAWAQAIPIANLETQKLNAAVAAYQGKEATRLIDHDGNAGLALLKGSSFKDGAIEVELAGKPFRGIIRPRPAALSASPFASRAAASKYECIYLRPTNGRADDICCGATTRRSTPRTRVGLGTPAPRVAGRLMNRTSISKAGAWTRYKIVVKGRRAELYVHDAAQPCLIVKDLKLGDAAGAVALWVGPGTEAYFTNLKVAPAP